MYKIKGEIEGIAPLLQDNPWNVKAQLEKKVITQGACSYYDERQLYKNSKGECCIPSKHIKGAMKWSGKKVKMGRGNIAQLIKACIFFDEPLIPLGKKKPDKIEENTFQTKEGKFQYKERPRFEIGWKAGFIITVFEDSLTPEKVHECLNLAGTLFGIGCRRPDYGRFIVKEFAVMKTKKAA